MALRFSLRTLLLFILLTASAFALWYKWLPWRLEQTLKIDGYIHYANFSHDTKKIVVAGINYNTSNRDRGFCAIWQVSAQAASVKMVGHRDYVYSAIFSPDGQHVVTSSVDGTACTWDSVSGSVAVKLNHNSEVFFASYSPDGMLIATASEDGAQVWDLTGDRKLLLLSGTVLSVDFSQNGLHIITAECAGIARVWEVSTGSMLMTLSGHSDFVRTAVFSPDGTRIVTASDDGTVRVWDAKSGRELLKLVDHMTTVNSAQFSSDGQYLLVASEDDGVRVLEASSGKELWAFNPNSVGRSATYSSDGQRLAITGGGAAYIWRRQHPEYWWGVLTLVEWWLTTGLFVAMFWSIKLDNKVYPTKLWSNRFPN